MLIQYYITIPNDYFGTRIDQCYVFRQTNRVDEIQKY